MLCNMFISPTNYLWPSSAFREHINHLAFTKTLIVFLWNSGPVKSRNKIQCFETLHLFFVLVSVSSFFLYIVHLSVSFFGLFHISTGVTLLIGDWEDRGCLFSFPLSVNKWLLLSLSSKIVRPLRFFVSLLQLEMIAGVMKGMHSIKMHPLM